MKKDLTGMTFGKLTAIKPMGKNSSGNTLWECKCICGGTTVTINSNLTRGNSKSCGCTNSEKLTRRNTTHGMIDNPIYKVWASMHCRCYTKSSTSYKYYGQKGITVCSEWHDFKAFYNWAINNGFSEGLTIDRIETKGIYEPTNCRWVTQLVQANNKTNNLIVSVNGMTASLADICREFNINYKRTWKRLRLGWSIERAIAGA